MALSGIWQLRPMLNLMLESVLAWEETIEAGTSVRNNVVVVAPGLRGGWDIGDAQAVAGIAIPASFAEGDASLGVFGYFSYELPFSR